MGDKIEKNRTSHAGEGLWRALIQNLSDMIMIADGDTGQVSFESPSCARILGYPQGYFIGRTPWHVIHAEDIEAALKNFKDAVLRVRDCFPAVLRFRKADGAWVVLEALSDNQSDHPEISGIVIIFRDVTVRWEIQERHRGILQTMDSGYFEVDLRGSFTFFNQALLEFLGYSASEMMGMNFRAFMSPEEATYVFHLFNRVYLTGEPMKNFYWQYRRKDGVKAHSVASAYLLRNASGVPVGFRGTARDVTELRQVEEALREREETFRALAENSRDFIARLDRGYRFLYANPAIKQRMGFAPEDVVGKTNADLGYPHHLVKLWQDAIDQVFTTGKTHRIEYEFVDGAWIDLMLMPEFDANGTVRSVLTASRNITDYKRIVSALEDSERRLAQIFDFLPDATAVIDQKGIVTMWNRAIEEMSGIKASDIIRKKRYQPGRLFHGEKRQTIAHLALERNEEAEKKYLTFSREGERVSGIVHMANMRRGQGAYLWGVAAPLRDAKGRITGAIESIRDITEIKQMEKTLNDTLGEMEKRVYERTVELEEANTALRVLLKHREEEQANLEKRLQINVNELVAPLIAALRSREKGRENMGYLDILEINLNEILSPFLQNFSSVYKNLSPKEIRVASMIRDGKNTKEIAELIGVSRLTIEKHRNNIRKKLGLTRKGANLRSFLLAVK